MAPNHPVAVPASDLVWRMPLVPEDYDPGSVKSRS